MKASMTALSTAFVLALSQTNMQAQSGGSTTMQEQRITEKRTVTNEDGKVSRTSSVIETKVEDIAPPTRHLIYAAPVRMIWMANLGYMRSITNSFAIGGNIEIPTSIDTRVQSGFGLSLEGRFYPSANGLRGFYVAPSLNFHSFQSTQYVYTQPSPNMPFPSPQQQQTRVINSTPFSFAATGGWVFNWGDLSLDLGLGFKTHIINGSEPMPNMPGVYYFGEQGVSAIGLDSFRGTMPTFRLNIGYSW